MYFLGARSMFRIEEVKKECQKNPGIPSWQQSTRWRGYINILSTVACFNLLFIYSSMIHNRKKREKWEAPIAIFGLSWLCRVQILFFRMLQWQHQRQHEFFSNYPQCLKNRKSNLSGSVPWREMTSVVLHYLSSIIVTS